MLFIIAPYFLLTVHFLIIKLILLQRLELRAQKFGLPLSTEARKEARAARFGSETDTSKPTKIVTATKIIVQVKKYCIWLRLVVVLMII